MRVRRPPKSMRMTRLAYDDAGRVIAGKDFSLRLAPWLRGARCARMGLKAPCASKQGLAHAGKEERA